MRKQEQKEKTIWHYLLGELSESEQSLLEEQYFKDHTLFEEIVRVENELVDKYARGLLPPATRDRFEKYYLDHPQRRERARFAEALAERIGEGEHTVLRPSAEASWFQRWLVSLRGPKLVWALAAAVLLIAAVAGWFFLDSRRLERQQAGIESERIAREQRERELQQQAEQERLPAARTSSEREQTEIPPGSTGQPSEEKKQPATATLILTIAGSRGPEAGPPSLLVIQSGTEQVKLRLILRENDHVSYQAVVLSAGGSVVFSSRRIRAANGKSGPSLTFNAPARAFPAGDYILTLRGVSKTGEVEDVSKSLFRVERK
jgi:hypothetical protein